MAPTHSKPLPEQPLLGTCKCILTTSLADPNSVDAAEIKRRRLEEAAAVCQLRQPSIKTVKDDEDNPTMLNHPQKASNVLEAADGSDNDETSKFDRGGSSVGDASMPGLTEEGESVNGDEEVKDDSEDEHVKLGKEYYSALDCLCAEWTSPIYAFFESMPEVTYSPEGCCAQEFHCASSHCRGKGANGWIV